MNFNKSDWCKLNNWERDKTALLDHHHYIEFVCEIFHLLRIKHKVKLNYQRVKSEQFWLINLIQNSYSRAAATTILLNSLTYFYVYLARVKSVREWKLVWIASIPVEHWFFSSSKKIKAIGSGFELWCENFEFNIKLHFKVTNNLKKKVIWTTTEKKPTCT